MKLYKDVGCDEAGYPDYEQATLSDLRAALAEYEMIAVQGWKKTAEEVPDESRPECVIRFDFLGSPCEIAKYNEVIGRWSIAGAGTIPKNYVEEWMIIPPSKTIREE